MAKSKRDIIYPPLPFHSLRILLFLSSAVLAGSLGFFAYRLKVDGYKIPWTFLINFLAAFITLIVLILTSCIHVCGTLSPMLNMVMNFPLTLIWIAGTCLFTYNTVGTLSHSCNKVSWGNSDGIMVCNIYKTIFAFLVVGMVSHLGLLFVDVRGRRLQSMSGTYFQMQDVSSSKDIKMDSLSTHDHDRVTEPVPYGVETYHDNNSVYPQRPTYSRSHTEDNAAYADPSHLHERNGHAHYEDTSYRPAMHRYASDESSYHDDHSSYRPQMSRYQSDNSTYREDYSYHPRQQRPEYDLGTYNHYDRRY